MSININIDTQSTIRYRTDCFGDGYTDEPYHIRDHSQYDYGFLGYTPKISNVGANGRYSIGYNPSGGTWEGVYSHTPYVVNPTICDGLIYNGLYTGIRLPTDPITKVPYKELLFQVPAIAIKRSVVATSSMYGARLHTDELTRLDRVYVDSNNLNLCGEGIIYENGIGQSYNGVLEYNLSGVPTHFDEIRIVPDRSYSRSADSGYIATYNELLDIFAPTDSSFEIWRALEDCLYGGILRSVYRSASDAVFCRVYRHQWGEGGWTEGVAETYYSSNWHWSVYEFFITPFLSQDEFDAAYAANYKWDDATIQQIDQYIN